MKLSCFFCPRTGRQWLLSVVILAFFGVLVSWLLMRTTPSWYVPLDPTSELMERVQNGLELRLGSKLHNALESVPLGEQSWSISQDEVNALIATRGESLPVSGAMVIFSPGKITVAARHKKIPSGHPDGGVVSVVITILNSPCAIKIHSAWLGRFPVPKAMVESRLAAMMPEIVATVQGQTKLQPMLTGILRGERLPEFIYNQRQVAVKEIRVEDGLFTIIFVQTFK